MAEHGSAFDGMPWWIRAVTVVGFPVVLSVGLLWYFLTVNLAHVEETVQAHKAMNRAVDSLAYTNFIMCQRSAVNKEEAEKCARPPSWTP